MWAISSTVLPEEVVAGHCESSHQHHVLLEVHLPISILVQLLHHLVDSIRILLGLWREERRGREGRVRQQVQSWGRGTAERGREEQVGRASANCGSSPLQALNTLLWLSVCVLHLAELMVM